MAEILFMVIPCYNEETVLPSTSMLFLETLTDLIKKGKIDGKSRILFVDDGSSDGTWNVISDLAKKDGHFLGMSLSTNRGHQNALLAGLMEAKEFADITIFADCDGQDDIDAIEKM
ncbi:MAG: glycosyltransferase, partial [Treponemataceae bacterium]|nr:glycosyltransferase [Treponemataceae bacterium]